MLRFLKHVRKLRRGKWFTIRGKFVFNFMMHNKLSFWTDKYFLFSEKGFGLNGGKSVRKISLGFISTRNKKTITVVMLCAICWPNGVQQEFILYTLSLSYVKPVPKNISKWVCFLLLMSKSIQLFSIHVMSVLGWFFFLDFGWGGGFVVCVSALLLSVLVSLSWPFSTFTSRVGNMRSPQVFLPAALSCTVITHLDPHQQ